MLSKILPLSPAVGSVTASVGFTIRGSSGGVATPGVPPTSEGISVPSPAEVPPSSGLPVVRAALAA